MAETLTVDVTTRLTQNLCVTGALEDSGSQSTRKRLEHPESWARKQLY
jgi:hypothetical protein